ncbi:hypothetical protein [Kineococcus sp. SYSU DK005]|uniref:hypothetical protein n=1 Tax=Kineococcus sp. SYSU DK005 TaxID=3383126 RepID=UPI003D7CA36B
MDKDGPILPAHRSLGPCWLWTGPVTSGGYGIFRYRGRTFGSAHRYAWRLQRGAPGQTHLDHLCHSLSTWCRLGVDDPHRRCVNLDHLEPFSARENNRRRHHASATPAQLRDSAVFSTCRRGHTWDIVTTLYDRRGNRLCRSCLEGLE